MKSQPHDNPISSSGSTKRTRSSRPPPPLSPRMSSPSILKSPRGLAPPPTNPPSNPTTSPTSPTSLTTNANPHIPRRTLNRKSIDRHKQESTTKLSPLKTTSDNTPTTTPSTPISSLTPSPSSTSPSSPKSNIHSILTYFISNSIKFPKWVTHVSSTSFAEQWTILDMKCLREIHPTHVFQLKRTSWNTMMKRGETLSSFILSQIVQEQDIDDRLKVLSHFIQIALKFLAFNNFNGLMYTLQGLCSTSLGRMKGTWSALSRKEPKAFEAFAQLRERLWNDNPKQNPNDDLLLHHRSIFNKQFDFLRTSVQTQLDAHNETVVPWIKVLDMDLQQIESLNDLFFHEHIPLLNFEKMYGLSHLMKVLLNSQKSVELVNIDEDNQNNNILQNLLNHLTTLTDTEVEKYVQADELTHTPL